MTDSILAANQVEWLERYRSLGNAALWPYINLHINLLTVSANLIAPPNSVDFDY